MNLLGSFLFKNVMCMCVCVFQFTTENTKIMTSPVAGTIPGAQMVPSNMITLLKQTKKRRHPGVMSDCRGLGQKVFKIILRHFVTADINQSIKDYKSQS